jgi:DNA-binding GntR family transcriptional regulator
MNTIMRSEDESVRVKGLRQVTDEIRAAIANGERKPGQRLIESQLCELFGVKRNMIREALRKLEHEGLVKITPNAGATVTEFSRSDIEQVYDLLSVLEGLAVRVATPFVTEGHLLKLERLVKRMEQTDKQPVFADYNDEFHALLCSLSENSRLISFTESLRFGMRAFGYRSFSVPGQRATSREEHREIVEAIKANNPIQAEQLMRDHLISAKNKLVKWLYRSL